MLTSLSIRDVVLIEALDLEFAPGLSALTGETGAGKSILLDSLGLALGARGEAALVRHGAGQAAVSAVFSVAPDHPARALLAENGLEGGEAILVRRVVKADGGSRAFLQDQPVGAALLREVGGLLVEIHGQHDERGLLNPRGHRALLDAYGGLEVDVDAAGAAYEAWRAAEAALGAARDEVDRAARDREFLEHAVAELEKLAPEPGEEEELARARADMQKGVRLAEDLTTATELLGGSDGGLAGLRQAARRLERIADEHPLLGEALAAIDRAVDEASTAEDRLDAAARALAFDPARLEAVEARLFELRGVARKHRVEVEALPELAERMAAQLEAIETGADRLARLEQAVRDARRAFTDAAGQLSAARRQAATRLDEAVAGELAPLKLGAARFRVAVEPLDERAWSAAGSDRVEFEVATNPGAPFGPLIRIASGGELSRFTLALKVALAATRQAATLIFDEIDRGVGGAVASAIGERLARLAGETQVLVVTHSPQVAAAAGHQWRISKAQANGAARTRVEPLGEGERREEIARMLSGAVVTEEARAQAGRLLARAPA